MEIGYFLSGRSLWPSGRGRSLRCRRHLRKPFRRRPDVLDRRAASPRLGPDTAVEEPDELKSRPSSTQHGEHVSRRITGRHLKERGVAFIRLVPAYIVVRFEYKEPKVSVYVEIRFLGAVWVAEIDAAVPDRLVRQRAYRISWILTHTALEVIERLSAERNREITALPCRRYVGGSYFAKYLHAVAVFAPDYLFFPFGRGFICWGFVCWGFVCCWSFIVLIVVGTAYIVAAEIIIIVIIGIGIVAAGVSSRIGVRVLWFGCSQLRGMPLDLFHKLSGLLWPKQRHRDVKDVAIYVNNVVRKVVAWNAYDYVRHDIGDRLRVHPAAQYFDGASHVPYDLSKLIPRHAGPSKILHYEHDIGLVVVYD